MSGLKATGGKHLTPDEHQEIMECLDKGVTFKAIARRVGKDPRTVSREIKRHLVTFENNPVESFEYPLDFILKPV